MNGIKRLVKIVVWTVVTGFGLLLALGYYLTETETMEYDQPSFALQLEDARLELVGTETRDYGEANLYLLTMSLTNTSNITDTFADYIFKGELDGCSVFVTDMDDRGYLLDNLSLLPAGQTSTVEILLEITSYDGEIPQDGQLQLSWMDWQKEEEQPLGSVELPG